MKRGKFALTSFTATLKCQVKSPMSKTITTMYETSFRMGSDLTSLRKRLAFSHIKSVPRESLGSKTPYETFAFFYGEEMLEKLHVSKIEKDDVTLMPYLLKSQNTAK